MVVSLTQGGGGGRKLKGAKIKGSELYIKGANFDGSKVGCTF